MPYPARDSTATVPVPEFEKAMLREARRSCHRPMLKMKDVVAWNGNPIRHRPNCTLHYLKDAGVYICVRIRPDETRS